MELNGSFIDWFAKGLGQPEILGAAAGMVVLEEEMLFPLLFPLEAWVCFLCGSPGYGGQRQAAPTIMELRVKANSIPQP